MRRAGSRGAAVMAAALLAIGVAACGSTGILSHTTTAAPTPTAAADPAPLAGAGSGAGGQSPAAKSSTPQQLGFPYLPAKNNTRVYRTQSTENRNTSS